MAEVQQSIFIVSREDRAVDPKTVIAEGLRIGRLPDSDVWLNHPQVSRLHAGINRVGDDFYLINLSGSSPTTLNGRVVPFNEVEAIVPGDEIQIGPFFLRIEKLGQRLGVKISLSTLSASESTKPPTGRRAIGSNYMLDSGALRAPTGSLDLKGIEKPETRPAGVAELSNSLQVFWAKRTRDKAGRPSPLHPRKPPRLGKARFNWTPSRDLVRPWPFAIFVWAAAVIAAFAVLAVYAHKNAFAPEAISDPHTRMSLAITPVIATRVNGNSCTSCHAIGISVANKEKMNANCEACHHTDTFVATVIPEHRAAGITCVTCHEEHRGASFSPLNYALASCARCHNDQNQTVHNGEDGAHAPRWHIWLPVR